jgi:hypothetical protein
MIRGSLARAVEEEPMLNTPPAVAASVVLSIERRLMGFSVLMGGFIWEFMGSVGLVLVVEN